MQPVFDFKTKYFCCEYRVTTGDKQERVTFEVLSKNRKTGRLIQTSQKQLQPDVLKNVNCVF